MCGVPVSYSSVCTLSEQGMESALGSCLFSWGTQFVFVCLESEEAECMRGQNICGAASPGSFLNTKLYLEPQA